MKSDIPIEPEALSIEQACAFTGIGKTKIYELIGSRALKNASVGTAALVPAPRLARISRNAERIEKPTPFMQASAGTRIAWTRLI